VCRYTPRKIRAIAATSWKQKDWLAPATLPAFSPLPGKQNPRTRRKRPARAITGGTILLDGGSQRPSGLPHHGTHTRKCALNFEIIGTLARPQPSATIRIRNRQPTRSSHCYLYITSIELGYFSDHRRLRRNPERASLSRSRGGHARIFHSWTDRPRRPWIAGYTYIDSYRLNPDTSTQIALHRLNDVAMPANSRICNNPVTTPYGSRLVSPYGSCAGKPTDTDPNNC
jgi:hypothetical protein